MIVAVGTSCDEQTRTYGAEAETHVGRWLESGGYRVVHLPRGQYGPDIRAEMGAVRMMVAVERRASHWQTGPWPYERFSTVRVLERRMKELHDNESRGVDEIFVTTSIDMTCGVIVFPEDVRDTAVARVDTSRGPEPARDVPHEWCLRVSLTTPPTGWFIECMEFWQMKGG